MYSVNRTILTAIVIILLSGFLAGLQPAYASAPALSGRMQIAASHPAPVLQSGGPGYLQKFQKDLAGNTLAVVVLAGMIASALAIAFLFVKGDPITTSRWPGWILPVLAAVGFGVAIYLSFVEVTRSEAFCGPIGNCNSVQQSPYARLFDVLPVGILGAIGYIGILVAWLVYKFSTPRISRMAALAIWAMAWIGLVFSIYLTFLEPFVIGATCIWCISSAIIMTVILWVSTGPAQLVLQVEDDEEGDLALEE